MNIIQHQLSFLFTFYFFNISYEIWHFLFIIYFLFVIYILFIIYFLFNLR